MNAFELVLSNLLSPVVLAFLLGWVATLVGSDLRIPESVYSLLTIYLLFALGLKGGAELSEASFAGVWRAASATLLASVVTSGVAFLAARALRYGKENAGALAAHYGSVSVVTFISVTTFLDALKVPHESYLSSMVVLLEAPAIVFGLLLARGVWRRTPKHVEGSEGNTGGEGNSGGEGSNGHDGQPEGRLRDVLHEILSGRSILLLVGGLVIGWLSGKKGLERVEAFYVAPFQGAVSLFLLEMGLVSSRRFLEARRKKGFGLLVFGTVVPLVNALVGILLGSWAGLTLGGQVIMGTMAASASYIAAPAAVRIALPGANPGIYLTAALTITFPFNLVVGIPLYLRIARLCEEFLK